MLTNGRTWLKSLLWQARQICPSQNLIHLALHIIYKLSITLSIFAKIFWHKVKLKARKKQNIRSTEVAATEYLTPAICPDSSYKHTCTHTLTTLQTGRVSLGHICWSVASSLPIKRHRLWLWTVAIIQKSTCSSLPKTCSYVSCCMLTSVYCFPLTSNHAFFYKIV